MARLWKRLGNAEKLVKRSLHKDLLFSLVTSKFKKDTDKDRHNTKKYGHDLGEIKAAQHGSPYAKWLKYLKENKLYMNYRNNIRLIIQYEHHSPYYKSISGFDPSDLLLNSVTESSVQEIVNYIDNWNVSQGFFLHFCRWSIKYNDYRSEVDLIYRKKILSRKLYHMDEPKVTHHKYLGKIPLRKSFLDKVLDKIFLIKHEN